MQFYLAHLRHLHSHTRGPTSTLLHLNRALSNVLYFTVRWLDLWDENQEHFFKFSLGTMDFPISTCDIINISDVLASNSGTKWVFLHFAWDRPSISGTVPGNQGRLVTLFYWEASLRVNARCSILESYNELLLFFLKVDLDMLGQEPDLHIYNFVCVNNFCSKGITW